jgi:hypothetical protein
MYRLVKPGGAKTHTYYATVPRAIDALKPHAFTRKIGTIELYNEANDIIGVLYESVFKEQSGYGLV